MLQITDLTFRMMGRPLFEEASAVVPEGMKVGLVGRNGTGKTTLFRLITGDLAPDGGSIELPKGLRIGQVAQEAPGTEQTLMEVVLAADTERAALLAEAETATDPDRIAAIHTRLADIDAHSAEARAGAILSGLGFDAEAQQRPCSTFSGGWRMRVALAAVLFSAPDLLLLDEPTNYLDLEGTLWLENYVQRYPHTVIVISHDRDLLNATTNAILHLENRKLTFYRGNYDQFARTRAEKIMLATKMAEKQAAQRRHMEAFVERFRYKASKARQAQSRLKALERMAAVEVPVDTAVQPIHLPSPERQPASPIIAMEGVSVGYADAAPVLSRLSLRIDNDDRIALLGANGNGKSTFAKLVAGRLGELDGRITRADKLKIAMFAQHQLDDLVPEQTPYDHVRALMPDQPEAKVRARVAQMGLGGDRMDTKAKDLSGGERARLLIGLVTFEAPHLLILDEPTNHLDIDSRAALADALNDYRGAVILISHDRHLIEACAERLWLVHDGTVRPYDEDMEAYKRLILKGPEKTTDETGAANAQNRSSKEKRKQAAAKRAEFAPLKKRIAVLEKRIEKAQQEIIGIDAEMTKPDVLADSQKIIDLSKKRSGLENDIANWEEEWMTLSAEYEEAMADA
ncbi:ABC-F family ATP-binding cassette domain-containing protein [Oricola thermophila]|uniref:ABC-F family ATP-binding cassette domain-containing protein n=1 Tax=Oricola thermophila TaxID=2742145 RepID=A0A6N1VD17_9HYPH|nr:ABC-F family ATP-binding cassette domain-containing protein [Oricola thermophila]QKV18413.1 ABC-F family ATP-binding cassette domain-containing protein [Oricola thermophila]